MRLPVIAANIILATIAFFIIVSGCSGSIPTNPIPACVSKKSTSGISSHYAWGIWRFIADPTAQTLEINRMRMADYHLNTLPFLEPPALVNITLESLKFNGNIIETDIGLRHPFSGLTEFTGFDVCGILITNGSVTGFNDTVLRMAGAGDTRLLNPDGYTRWWNPAEFPLNTGSIFGYSDGLLGTKDSIANFNSTLNAYKYFCDDLGPDDPLANATLEKRGMFSAGNKKVRHYTIEFTPKGLIFNYAVDACWKTPTGSAPWTAPDDFEPEANRPEAWNIKVTETANTLWNDGSSSGGYLSLSIDVWDHFNAGLNSIRVESPGNFSMSESASPVDGGPGFSTYKIDITNAHPAVGEIESLISVVCEKPGFQGFIPGTNTTAYFVHNAQVGSQPVNTPPMVTGITDDIPPDGLNKTVTASDTSVTYIALFDDPDPGQDHTFKWYIEDSSATEPSEPPDGMPYNWALQAPGGYKIWVKVSDGFDEATGGPYAVTRASDYGWTRTWGIDAEDRGYGVAVDGAGYSYVTGRFSNKVDFNPGEGEDWHTSLGGYDIYLSKFDPSGTFLWAKTWGADLDDYGRGVAVDGSGGIYVTGYFMGTVDFDPGLGTDNHGSGGTQDVFLSKFDSSGSFVWAKTWGAGSSDQGFGIATDKSNNIYVTGAFTGTVDFDPGTGTDWHSMVGGYDAFLSKFNSSGGFTWARTWGDTGLDEGCGVTTDISGNVYVTGFFDGTVDFDPSSGEDKHTSNGNSDVFLSKFNSSGSFTWARTWGGSATAYDYSFGVATDGLANVYVSGNYSGTCDFDPGLPEVKFTSNGSMDVFLSKFDPSGTFIWVKVWGAGSGALDQGHRVAVDASDNVYVTGSFEGTVDFNPGTGSDPHISKGGYDAFLSSFDSSGGFLWVKTWGAGSADEGYGVAVDGTANVYVTGYFTGTVDFDPGTGEDWHASNGGKDAFLSKFLFK